MQIAGEMDWLVRGFTSRAESLAARHRKLGNGNSKHHNIYIYVFCVYECINIYIYIIYIYIIYTYLLTVLAEQSSSPRPRSSQVTAEFDEYQRIVSAAEAKRVERGTLFVSRVSGI